MIQIPLSTNRHSTLEVAMEAARRAGDVAMQRFFHDKKVSYKGRANVVTDVDVMAEKAALAVLQEEYPDFGILSEESEPILTDSPYSWIVDPLDGTRNYVSGVPHFCVVVALALKGEMVLGVTFDPVRNEMFHAESGKGTYLNGSKVSVSSKEELVQCLLGFDMGYVDEKAVRALKLVQGLWPNMQSVRIMGSSALGLAYTACGRIDLYFHHHLYPWDIASGLLLVKEAGGVVVDNKGKPAGLNIPSVIASSPLLVSRFLDASEGMEWRD